MITMATSKWLSIRLLSGLLSLVTFNGQAVAQNVAPKVDQDIALHISFTDGLAITKSGMRDLSALLKKQMPDMRIATAQASTKRLGYLTAADAEVPRDQMINQLRDSVLQPGEQIRLLILSTHASSDDGISQLSMVGEISAEGLDDRAKEFFAPLAGRFAPDARIVLEACSTLCGTDEAAGKRVRRLFEFLNIPNGSLFGATTPMSSLYSHNNSWKMFVVLAFGTLGIAEAMTVADLISNRDLLSSIVGEGSRMNATVIFLKNFALASGLTIGLRYGVYPIVQLYREARGVLNLGKVFSLNDNGDLITEIGRYSFDRDAIFFGSGRSCESVFKTSN